MTHECDAPRIRPSASGDAEAFHRCLDAVARERRWLAMVEAPPVEQVRAFVAAVAEKRGVQLFACRGEVIVGWCDVIPFSWEGFGHGGALGMGLLPEERGRGLGARLLGATLDRTRELGIHRVELEVYDGNEPAIRLYERHGFTHEGVKQRARILDGRVEDVLVMARLERDGG